MKQSETIKQNEMEEEYNNLLAIYEHYIYDLPSKEGYILTEEDMERLITGYCTRYERAYTVIESRLYHELRPYDKVVESL
ncbi:hypothetical protein CBR59_07275 [Bacillus thuringiensis]|uniref:Gp50 n=2 Tax=Lwoffvirus TP21 TaxID=57478 RepID=B8R859_9CAUD|nr:hypothetical protein [Bacillus thuringiensis]YP_002333611.1 gp50 [Bacillus phage TP21-L]ANT40070.1 hypothetical protein BMBtpLA3_35 [Bacillus phage BMBtpLA3]MEB8636829.1 hypothetical protein [Bacillus cereus]ACJ70576.1 gp50 [Bacillus phage TP21-L]EXY08852.1 hypothetical protein BF15_04530 [Bacillus thuringiensis]MEB8743228.1 hypothetical protein [Bacillus cereus]